MFKPKYRCLMCGAEEFGPAVETEMEASHHLNRTVFLGGQFGAPAPFTTHKCGCNRLGIMALVGYVGSFEKEAKTY